MISLQSKLVTGFHRSLADARWMAACEAFVTERLRLSGAFRTDGGTGVLSSYYNEDRYMGPQSVVKHQFQVKVRVSRGSEAGTDSYQTFLEYDPERAVFTCLQEVISTVEGRIVEAAIQRLEIEAQSLPGSREAFEEFRRRQCPVCETPIRIELYPEGNALIIQCPRNPDHGSSKWLVVSLNPAESWNDLAADRTCPRCSSPRNVVGILYGTFPDDFRLDPSVWSAGGCIVGPEKWYCRDCERRF